MIQPIPVTDLDGRYLYSGGTRYHFFAGTSYLGLNYHDEFIQSIHKNIQRSGSSYGGSRNANFAFEQIIQLEKKFSEWLGTEQFITTSSGSLSCYLMDKVIPPTAKVIIGPNIHPALQVFDTGKILPVPGHDPETISNYLAKLPPGGTYYIVLNSVDPVKLEVLQPRDWTLLPEIHQYQFIIDDSHGIGVIGNGKGIYTELPESIKDSTILVGSLGKALGLPAGFIAGSKDWTSAVKALPHFSGASPFIPAYAAAFLEIFQEINIAFEKLQVNHNHLANLFNQSPLPGWNHHDMIPIWTSNNSGIYTFLLKKGVCISSFSYPTPFDPVINRIVLSARHTLEDIDYLWACLKQFDDLEIEHRV
jgi:8-amino-7-oxononanoate synthase